MQFGRQLSGTWSGLVGVLASENVSLLSHCENRAKQSTERYTLTTVVTVPTPVNSGSNALMIH